MAFLHDEGELLVLDSAFNARDVEIGLFNDATDTIAEGDTYSAITTEPSSTDYNAQTVTGPTVSQDGSGVTTVEMGTLTYTVSDATQDVDYVYVRDASSGDLIFTNEMNQTYDLGSIDTLELSNVGLQLD